MAEAKGIDRRELITAAGALGLLTARGNTSRDNRPLALIEEVLTWTARADAGEARYLAMFNVVGDKSDTKQVHFNLSRFGLASARVRDLWAQQDLGISRERVTAALAPHACLLYSVTPV